MNIEEMIYNGASEEEIQKALNQIKAEKARQEAALRAEDSKEKLKQEAREYAINALIAYSYAFDLLPEDEDFSQDDIDKLEEMLKGLEDMIPLYVKMHELQDKMDNDLFKGLF